MSKFVVTGGGGFVGSNLCKKLRLLGHDVLAIGRGRYPALEEAGITLQQIDIGTGRDALSAAFAGADCVFHTAAKVSMWGKRRDFVRTNVRGTENVIAACLASGVDKLVFTSSPSVVAGADELRNADESVKYPDKYLALYPETKAIAEQLVLAANGSKLKTLALRPHLIFGPGDTNLIPTVVRAAKSGRLKQIGDGSNLSDFTYIDDCVEAHLCAAKALATTPASRGRAYFISQGDPVPLWEWIARVMNYSGINGTLHRMSPELAYTVASIVELSARALPVFQPTLTRFLVKELATNHYFDISAARDLLGYNPLWKVFDALEYTFTGEINGQGKSVNA